MLGHFLRTFIPTRPKQGKGLTMYNGTFYITAERGNNVISFIWSVGSPTTYTWTIPDGYYSVNDLNYYIQI